MKRFGAQKAYLVCMVIMSVFIGILSGCGGGGGGVWTEPVGPVSSTVPANAATVVPIGSRPTITFSEAMDPATINTTTFTVKQGATPVSGTVSYSGVTAVFTPAGNFAANTVYTATITTGAKTLGGKALKNDYVWNFTTGTALDTTAPTVSSTVPATAATGVATNSSITAAFSEPMDPATISTTTFTVKQGTTPVPGTVTYSGVTAVFKPTSILAASLPYTATITTGAKDLAGNALASNSVWSFTTGAVADTIPPTVISTLPSNAATGVATNSTVSATFSEAMDPLTITTTTFTVKQGATPVPGTVTYSGVIAVFTPTSTPLAASLPYTATITTGAKDLAGNVLASNYVWSWTTGAALDTTPPKVITGNPANLATLVSINSVVRATFDEAMNSTTITNQTFTVKAGTIPVTGTVTYDAITKIATFAPSNPLAYNTNYTVTVSNGAKDLAGNALVVPAVSGTPNPWTFRTELAPLVLPPNPTAPVLGAAANYAILAKTGVSTVPGSKVTGNVGLSPTARIGLTGWSLITEPTDTFFTSAQVVAPFKLFAADNVGGTTSVDLTTAVLNMQTAYTAAAGQTATSAATTNVGAGTLTGLTLTRGVYEWGGNVVIPTDLTLNGSATDVWIFKVAGTLNMAAARNVILTGGALAKNIFWQVSGAVTIGTNSHFEGIILGQTAITFGNLASINGRLLAQSAVILDATTVTQPAP